MKRLVIAGGSGFIGRSLTRHLVSEGCEVTVLSRTKPEMDAAFGFVKWDGRTLGDWAACLDGAFALVNLAGRTVDCVKTPDHCDEILRSRVDSTRTARRSRLTCGRSSCARVSCWGEAAGPCLNWPGSRR